MGLCEEPNVLWTVDFSLVMNDVVNSPVPSMRGSIVVYGKEVREALIKAEERLEKFGFDSVLISGICQT